MNFKQCEKGLSLIELLVTLAIIGFIIMAIYTFYLAGLKGWQRSLDQIEAQQSARIAMDKIIRELRYADEISLHDHDREIRFKLKGDSRTLRFRLEGQELIFDSYPTGHFNYMHTKIALGISALNFSIEEDNLVMVTIAAVNGSNPINLKTRVRPRNIP